MLAVVTTSTAFFVLSIIAVSFFGLSLFLAFFEPGLKYQFTCKPEFADLNSEKFLSMIETLTDAKASRTDIEVLTNGENYYPAELAAIRAAQQSINLEAYIFQRGKVAEQFLAALTERAQAGVKVNLVLDAVGCLTTWDSYVKRLRDAGGRVAWYQPLRWFNIPRFNNRTHRELLVIDGKVGFIGGSGVADHWLLKKKKDPRWRDSMFRIEGQLVAGLQATFVENWLEATGEILCGNEYFPCSEVKGAASAIIVNSSPSFGRSTRARILFQTLLAAAQKSIYITSPYFLPDASIRKELVRAIKERGVEVKVIVPGNHTDHQLTRRSGRRLFGDLLQAGAKIFEYQPSMIHAKILIVDGIWSVVGSTNFDNRSFRLNDEVNMAVMNSDFALKLSEDFQRDLVESKRLTYQQWRKRSIFERLEEAFGSLIERQQ